MSCGQFDENVEGVFEVGTITSGGLDGPLSHARGIVDGSILPFPEQGMRPTPESDDETVVLSIMTAKLRQLRPEECSFLIIAAQDKFSQINTSEESAIIRRTDLQYKEIRSNGASST